MVGACEARFRDGMTYGPVPGDKLGEMGYFDSQGLVLVGDRVMLVTMAVAGYDSNWAYDERSHKLTGLAWQPMFRILPEAAYNLAR